MAPFTIRDAEFRGRMLPCRAVLAEGVDATGDAFAGLTADGWPVDGARGAYVRGVDDGRF